MTTAIKLFSAALLFNVANAAQIPSQDNGLRAIALRPAINASWQHQVRDTVRVTLPLDQDMDFSAQRRSAVNESRGYWQTISGKQLKQGIDLPITAADAVLQISPMNGNNAAALAAENLSLNAQRIDQRGDLTISKTDAGATQNEFHFAAGSVQLKLKTISTPQRITLQSNAVASDTEQYVVQVLEAQSPYALRVTQASDTVLNGQALQADGRVLSPGNDMQITQAQAELIAPDGRRWSLPLSRSGAELTLTQTMEYAPSDQPGLWQIEWRVNAQQNGVIVQRTLRSAVQYGNATAQWRQRIKTRTHNDQIHVVVPVEAISAGRYELRAIAAKSGATVTPLALVSSAQWLEPGLQQLTLMIDKAVLRAAGINGEFSLVDARLYDQSRMLLLQQQAQLMRLTMNSTRRTTR